MFVYRIVAEKYANKLSASGVANRWNKKNEMVIYASHSRSLATLEMIVHRNNINPKVNFKILKIEIMDTPDINNLITKVSFDELPKNWQSINSYPILQEIGSDWYKNNETLIMSIPSVLMPQESNFVINLKHKSFEELIKLSNIEPFFYDNRYF